MVNTGYILTWAQYSVAYVARLRNSAVLYMTLANTIPTLTFASQKKDTLVILFKLKRPVSIGPLSVKFRTTDAFTFSTQILTSCGLILGTDDSPLLSYAHDE